MPYKDAVLAIMDDLIKVHDAILADADWEERFDAYRPYESANYMDTGYNPVSEGFAEIPGIEQTRVAPQVHYTYHELYHRFWYRCYRNGSMAPAYQALSLLRQTLSDSGMPHTAIGEIN